MQVIFFFIYLNIGSIGTLLGLGGNIIIGPVLLELGVDQRVMTASAGLMKLLTSTASIFLFLVNGVAQIDFAFFFGIVGFIGSVIGFIIN